MLFPGQFSGDNGLSRETIANYLAQEMIPTRRAANGKSREHL